MRMRFRLLGPVLILTTVWSAQSHAQSCTQAQLDKRQPCADAPLLRADEKAVEVAFRGGNFAELDRLYERWSKGTERYPDGRWKLVAWSRSLGTVFEKTASWDGLLKDIHRWQAASPQSFAARMAEVNYWREYAWQARGQGYAREVPDDKWALFEQRLDKAEALMRELRPRAVTYPEWYALYLRTMVDRGKPLQSIHDVFVEGAKRFPEYHGIYGSAARGYEPKWGGSREQYEAFADEAARMAAGFEGPGMYARVYSLVDIAGSSLAFNPAANSKGPPWSRLKVGYEALIRRYPSSINLLNQYASAACRADEGELYRQLRDEIDGNEDHEAFAIVPVAACDKRHHWTNQLPER